MVFRLLLLALTAFHLCSCERESTPVREPNAKVATSAQSASKQSLGSPKPELTKQSVSITKEKPESKPRELVSAESTPPPAPLMESETKKLLTPEELFLMQQREDGSAETEGVDTPSPTASPSEHELLEELAAALEEEQATPAETPDISGEPLFTTEELKELQEKGSADTESPPQSLSDRLAGVRRTRTTQQAAPQREESKSSSSNSTQTTTGPLPLVGGQPRGYTLLYLMQPNARAGVEAAIDILLTSRVRGLTIGVLTDGTFGWNPAYLRQVVRRLNRGERRLTLVLYIANGSTMRRFDDSPIHGAFNQIEPERFRELIQYDPGIRSKFRSLAERLRPVVELNNSLKPQNRTIVVPMLEDNFDRNAYLAARALVVEALGSSVEIVRNPCPGCYPGNDADSVGDPVEFHEPTLIGTTNGRYGFSLDGTGFRHTFESPNGYPDTEQVRIFMRRSRQSNAEYFALWRHDRQGLGTEGILSPLDRDFAVPTLQQREAEIALLRYDLDPVEKIDPR